MKKPNVLERSPPVVATCRHCGGNMRLVSSEPHPTEDGVDLHAFACVSCGVSEDVAVRIHAASA